MIRLTFVRTGEIHQEPIDRENLKTILGIIREYGADDLLDRVRRWLDDTAPDADAGYPEEVLFDDSEARRLANEINRALTDPRPESPHTAKQIQRHRGTLAYLREFFSSGACHLIKAEKINRGDISLSWNVTCCNERCAVCGGAHDASYGWEVFFGGEGALVCSECVSEIAPELAAALTGMDRGASAYLAEDANA